MPVQVEIGVVRHVEWCRLIARRLIDNGQVVPVIEQVADADLRVSRKALLPIRTLPA